MNGPNRIFGGVVVDSITVYEEASQSNCHHAQLFDCIERADILLRRWVERLCFRRIPGDSKISRIKSDKKDNKRTVRMSSEGDG